MVWHYDGRNYGHSLAIEVAQRFSHDFCAVTSSQDTRTVASIEPTFDRA
jgi:hypothetical protein